MDLPKIKHYYFSLLVACTFLSVNSANASCANYPESKGLNFPSNSKYKLLSTAEVPVQFNDVEAINAALEEAEFIAKKQILELKEGVNLSSSIKGKLSTKQGTTIKVGGKKSQDFEKKVETVRNWTETTKGSLRGIGIVGDCYTKDSIVRVTVGFKDDFLQKGDALRDKMDKNLLKTLFKKRTDDDAFVNTYTTNLNTTESYSNSSRLENLN